MTSDSSEFLLTWFYLWISVNSYKLGGLKLLLVCINLIQIGKHHLIRLISNKYFLMYYFMWGCMVTCVTFGWSRVWHDMHREIGQHVHTGYQVLTNTTTIKFLLLITINDIVIFWTWKQKTQIVCFIIVLKFVNYKKKNRDKCKIFQNIFDMKLLDILFKILVIRW